MAPQPTRELLTHFDRLHRHRVKSYYGTDDPQIVEALALVRAAKRKMRG